MPADGDQHGNNGHPIINPYMEVKHTIEPYTAQQIATLQARLEKKLGPEWISQRPGQGGKKCGYVQANKVIELANDVFGFNGWSSQIKECQVDFVDERGSEKYDMGLSVIMRVTLRDGTFHEDMGYGHVENFKGKGLAFEKAKKEATTDALKRALRSFGNVLGNCIYDQTYMKEVVKMKVEPKAFRISDLHRHHSFATVPQKPEAKKDPEIKKDVDDEFDYDFDDADYNQTYIDPNAHPDEVVIEPEPRKTMIFRGNQNQQGIQQRSTSNGYTPPGNNGVQAQNRQAAPAPAPMQAPPRPTNMGNNPAPNQQQQQQPGQNQQKFAVAGQQSAGFRPNTTAPQPRNGQPVTPKSNFSRSYSGPVQGSANVVPSAGPPRQLNQPSRQGSVPPTLAIPPPAATISSAGAPPKGPPVPIFADPDFAEAPPGGFEVGFFSSRAVQEGIVSAEAPAGNIPKTAFFNPNAESPSIRKTAGVDHSRSHAVKGREPSVPPPEGAVEPAGFAQPRLQGNNRGAFKRPSMTGKRPGGPEGPIAPNQGQERSVLRDVPANTGLGGQQQQQQYARLPSNEPDVKRPRLNGP